MVFDTVRDIICEQLNVQKDEVTAETNLMKDLEADSIDAAEILIAIEEEYDIEIPEEEAEQFQTVDDLVKYVSGLIEA